MTTELPNSQTAQGTPHIRHGQTNEDLTEGDAVDLAAQVRSGELSATEVMTAHLERIEVVNPAVNALVDLRPEQAMAEARSIDALDDDTRAQLPLAGLPTAVKDLVPAAGFHHTQGSPIFAQHVATADAEIVSRMRAAGAIVISKTNTPEFGLGSQTFNPVYGATRNPYDLERTAGGSSGGAAAALASRMLPIADGSDTGGSLRNPASFCNITAIRPSLGTVSNHPSGFAFNTLSVKGPMARTTRDVALLFSTIVGLDSRDPMSYNADPTPLRQIAESSHGQRLGPQSLKAAWTPDFDAFFPVDHQVLSVLGPVVDRLGEIDIDVTEDFPDIRAAKESFRGLRAQLMLSLLGPLAEKYADQMKPEALWNIEAGRALTGEQAMVAAQAQSDVFRTTTDFFTEYDLLITPTVQVPPFDITHRYPRQINAETMSDYLDWMTLPSIITTTGHPAVSVPVGFTAEGWPVGLQIVGRYRDDAAVLEYAKRIEDLCGTAQQAPTADLSRAQDPFIEIT